MNVLKPPGLVPAGWSQNLIFLGGSIEQGKAVDWQTTVAEALQPYDVTLLNPRRDSWDATWEQSINNPKFAEQVNWELDGLERATSVIFYFDPNTKSPITLLEVGLLAGLGRRANVFVACPPKFWRRGNVEIVARRYGFNFYDSLSDLLVNFIAQKLQK